ncbi:N-acetylmuramoyl-L-alanine amidase [Pseudorhodobacter antarcticus]|uniref:N-acetylmuramoyl-L-alanine amidase n=1 Tax=Pseudorhodobacter antarcticus TaxID=1077947 RepID=A0A1H8MHD2_9RHOB|nr:N-acetylmuramoyl-L-alanine amidase [Pseudorhodobacter antarcticus]
MVTALPVAGTRARSAKRCSKRVPASPNFGERRDGLRPEFIVIHYTAMQSCAAAAARLCDPVAEVSAHYLIDYDGTVQVLVPEGLRAWHSGAGSWRGFSDMNSRSIGIELANDGFEPFPEPQMVALERLIAGIMARWGIGPAGVIAHSDMAPGRKTDPGARFDWRRLARGGLSVWPEAVERRAQNGVSDFDTLARAIGYDGDAGAVLAAFRLRFRPSASGPPDDTDVQLARSLANLIVDQTPPAA